MAFVKLPVKGMCDFLPEEKSLREKLLRQIKETYAAYGFEEIETPMMEHIENLCSRQGGDNEKLIFRVLKRGAELNRALDSGGELSDLGMRYDLTVPLARYYSNNMNNLPSPFKALQVGPVWRADSPQKGRFRQFVQCDIDILGDATNFAEIELICATADMLAHILEGTGAGGLTVHVNDRRMLVAAALKSGFEEKDVSSVLISLDKADKIGYDGVFRELVEKGYPSSVVGAYLDIYKNAERGISCRKFCENILNEEMISVADNLEEIIACSSKTADSGVKIAFDPVLVRGMGYYTGPIFEISVENYGFSVAGGGRYDAMIGKFIGVETPAVGFSIGFERIVTVLKDFADKKGEQKQNSIVYLVEKNLSSKEKQDVFLTAKNKRAEGFTVMIQPMKKNMKFQIDALNKAGYTQIFKVYHKD